MLTLVAAPAGFGKTTLLAEWGAATSAQGRPITWLSLDQSDNDPAFFWAYFIAALQKIQPGVGERALTMLQAPQPSPIKSTLATLMNEINAIGDDFALILDDYHVIEAQPIHSAIAFLLDHLPAQMHLIITSRSDPPWPLARLRSRGELTELRIADLRFTPDEVAIFLNQVMGLTITSANVAALEQRTEGWIAGLQLAALSMQGRENTAEFVAAFSGNDRYIMDYLVEEVLQCQPAHVRNFLLQTAMLNRLSGTLCNAVTGQRSSQEILESLERDNLFVVPLDNKRQWYRYHHLFADVLLARAKAIHPERIPILHRHASEWYEQNSSPADAIYHALAAEDCERAASLIELTWPAMRRTRQEATVLSWVQALPDTLIRTRPVLSVVCAWVLLNDNQLEAAEARLQDAEHWLATKAEEAAEQGSDRGGTALDERVVDEVQLRSLPATIANARAYRAQALGDISGTVMHTQQALNLLPEDDYYERGTTAALLGITYWASGI